MNNPSTQNDEQFLRRAFDAVYDFDIKDVKQRWNNIDRRVRWYMFSAVGVLLMVLVVTQLGKGVVNAVHQANLPKAYELLQAPYGLADEAIQLDTAALPVWDTFTQTPVELSNVNPIVACMVDYTTCTDEQLLNWVDLSSGISATYESETLNFNVTALRFANQFVAQDALENLYDYSSATGAMGNYVIMPSQPVRYYYGLSNGRLNFTWAVQNDIYTVKVNNASDLQSVMEMLRTAPPVITEGLSNG